MKKAYLLLLLAVILVGVGSRHTAAPSMHDGVLLASPTGAGHSDPAMPVLLALIVILASAKIGGHLFQRIGQPPVLGELRRRHHAGQSDSRRPFVGFL